MGEQVKRLHRRVSRRELSRRVEQGKQAMRVLAALVVDAGGSMTVKRETFETLPFGHKIAVNLDRDSNLVLTVVSE